MFFRTDIINFIIFRLQILIETLMNVPLFLQKKNCCRYISLLFFFFIYIQLGAQENTIVYRDSTFKKNADTIVHPYQQTKPYYITTWEGVVPNPIASGSIKLVRQLDDKMAIIEINNQVSLDAIKQQTKIAPANDHWKLSSFVERLIEKNNTAKKEYILCGLFTNELLAELEKITGQLTILFVDEPSHSVLVRTTAKFIKDNLLSLKELIFVDLRAEPHPEISIIGYNRSFHGLNAVDYSIPGANGKNIVAGVKEQKMEETDIDLYKRILPSSIAAANTTNHATVISSIIGGAGNSFYDGRGIAYGCKFFPSSFSNLFADDITVLNANKVTVQNHSYGTIIQQFYGAEAVSYDAQSWTNKNLIHVFSAGNNGTAFATDGKYANINGFANITGNFKMAKNVITVGAIDNKGNIQAESSAGPLYDGRVAPQLIALGPNGTSDAAAIVSGTAAVMQQVYTDSNGQALPPASLIKAVLYNNAEDIYNKGIDYKTGYGLLNSYTSIKAIQQKEYDGSSLSQGQQWTKTISIPANAAQLKVTLSWTDTSASLNNNNKALINDLDLEVQELSSGTIYKPWVLSAAANIDSLTKQPIRKRDSLNTAEQVSIVFPAAGNYQIKVNAANISAFSLPFNVAYHADTLNTFYFTSPQHASDVNRDENPNPDIRWRTFVADTNQTGNLYISYNSGANWQLIKALLKIYTNQYQWPVKDTNSTAQLKMETAFGDYFSKSFIIAKLTRPNVDFLCTDSFGLSWNKHVYANSYKIYTLTDSPYLKQISSVTDTFIVLKRSLYPSLVYAVEPILSNSLPAARSMALDINQQGVKCFYKTFYYNLLDQNKLDLVLELSAARYVDSIYFELVTATGQLQFTYGSAKVIGNNLIYNQLVNNLSSGITYFRGRIKLKAGRIVYTDIINVLTSGQHPIVFYPNPSDGSNPINYVLKQGIPAYSRLQLFDMTGRLLKDISSLPDKIDISAFPSGILIYRLIGSNNDILDRGKIIIIQK